MNQSIEKLYQILKPEVGPGSAASTISDIIYNIIDELEYSNKGVTEKNIHEMLKIKLQDYSEAAKKNGAA